MLWGWTLERLEAAAADPHGPGALGGAERERLHAPRPLDEAPPPVWGDYADWLDGPLERAFGEGRAMEGQALSARAPVDLRVNSLKSDVDHVIKALAAFHPEPIDVVGQAIRVPAPAASEHVRELTLRSLKKRMPEPSPALPK